MGIMPTLQTETLIIGGGPAGMATAMELAKSNKDFILVEKDESVGGLSKTYSFKESDGSIFYTDNGPHRFFSKNPYLYKFIGDLLDESWIKVKRSTKQYIDGKYYDYPINAIQALQNIGLKKASLILIDYVIAKIKYIFIPIRNFEDYVVSNFGQTLGRFNMINYSEKIWGIDAKDINSDWGRQRIKGLNLRVVAFDSLRTLFGKKKTNDTQSLVDEFYYPQKGTGQIYEAIKSKIENDGYKIMLSTRPTEVQITKNGFFTRLMDKDGQIFEVNSKYLVESVPITSFVEIIKGLENEHVLEATRKLKYRSQVYLFITLNKSSVSENQWIYFPSKNVPMARVSEMRNFSSYMSPPGKTSLFIEFFCFEGDDIWNMDKDDLLELILPCAKEADLFEKKDIRQVYRIQSKNTYPIYDLHYKQYLDVAKNYLNDIKNLFYIGRPGRFRYNNQDHSLEMGILAARSIIEGKLYDIESIGQEKDYFEKGQIKRIK